MLMCECERSMCMGEWWGVLYVDGCVQQNEKHGRTVTKITLVK